MKIKHSVILNTKKMTIKNNLFDYELDDMKMADMSKEIKVCQLPSCPLWVTLIVQMYMVHH